MRVVFDHQIFTMQRYGGISRYFTRLVEQLDSFGVSAHVVAPIHQNQHLAELSAKQVSGVMVRRFPPKTARVALALNGCISKYLLPRAQPDIIHETYYSSALVGHRSTRRVTTVHDMIHEKFPRDFRVDDLTSTYKRLAVQRADQVICVSHNTKRDLCEIFDIDPAKVTVVHLGFESFEPSMFEALNASGMQRPFLLYVGARSGYKNFSNFLQAVAINPVLQAGFDIVAFGGGAFSDSEMTRIKELGFADGAVKQFGGDDGLLGSLYGRAAALVYPSLYEGFGLPPLEAMACGCPVVTSNTSSIPEVVGEAGHFFDPTDIESIGQAIISVVSSPSRRETLVALGRERLRLFSWQRCAEQTRDVYELIS